MTCAQLGVTAPTGTACRSHFTSGGSDRLVARIAATAPKIAAVLQGIHARSPLARILLVGYPDVLPRTGNGCWPLVPLSPDDVRYFDGLIVQTNLMLAEQAAANGAEFADTYLDSAGHDVCTLPPTRWFEGLVPTFPAFPLHPNGLGMASMARSVLRVGERRPGERAVRQALAPEGRDRPDRAARRAVAGAVGRRRICTTARSGLPVPGPDIRSNERSHICARRRRLRRPAVAIMAPCNNACPTDSSAPAFRATGGSLAGCGPIRHASSNGAKVRGSTRRAGR